VDNRDVVVRDSPGDALLERVIGIVETVYSVPPGVVDAKSSRDTIEQWDSLGHLVLMLELEQEFGLQLSPDDTQGLTSVPAIVAMLGRRLA
jgi:acyl carrier protein